MRTFAAKKGLGDLSCGRIAGFGNDLGNHRAERFSHGGKLLTGAGTKLLVAAYTGTGTFSMISFSTWSDCSDFFRVEA
jgi:hypothetical protein